MHPFSGFSFPRENVIFFYSVQSEQDSDGDVTDSDTDGEALPRARTAEAAQEVPLSSGTFTVVRC